MGTKVKSYITIVIFLIMTGFSYVIWPFVKNSLEGENTENRNLAMAPTITWTSLSSFPASFESYINDHLPFRRMMIECNSMIEYYLFRSSSSRKVCLGKDNWLFYTADHSTDFYKGRKLYSDTQLQKIADNMQNTKDHLAEKDITFALFIAPNKERVYPEYLPDYYGSPAEPNALEQVLNYLQTHTDVTVVCPYDTLMRAKDENPEQLLYHKTDTHWNNLGAYIGTCDLLSALGIGWNNDHEVTVIKIQDAPGDMANMLNLGKIIDSGEAYDVSGYQPNDTTRLEGGDFFGHWKYVTPSANNGKLLVCRDSFCSAMAPVLGAAFSESDMVHKKSFDNSLIDEEQPDYFVYEVVERKLDALLKYHY